MRRARAMLVAALAIGCAWLPSVARAQEGAEPGSNAAEILFREGKALLDAGKLDQACRVLDESNRLEAAGGTLLNLASCYERLGRYASAERALAEAGRLAEAAGRDDAKRFIDERLAAVAPNVSTIRLKLTPDRALAATVLEVDRVRVELSGATTELRLDPGEHELRVETTGSPLWRSKLTLEGAGKAIEVDVERPPSAAPRVAKPPAAAPVEAPQAMPAAFEPLGIVGLALGGSLLVGGAIAGGLAIEAWSDAETRCPNPSCSDSIGVVRADDAATFGNASTALLVSGAVVALAGGAFILVANLKPSGPRSAWVGPTTLQF